MDELFVDGLSMKAWIRESFPHEITQVVDSNLLQDEGHHVDDILASISSMLRWALNCCADLPEERMNMADVVASLQVTPLRNSLLPYKLFEGLKEFAKRISFASGCPDVRCNSNDGVAEAIDAGKQMDLVPSVASASKSPVILVLTGGGPLDVSFAEKYQQLQVFSTQLETYQESY